ncbi:MAG: NAD(P)H-dependent oxidoreductase [Chloroflexota bacterium]|nr:NAD(P)H-dependent oxidoreductase [Chloroflexota bacterium]MDQ3690262.1 NAD(P)H-dependent oxidoreductase [Chloroflexota bacterium]
MTMTLLAFSGSLRRDSLNRRLISAARELAGPGLDVTVFDELAHVPLFDEDLEADFPSGPGAVHELRALVAAADGVLIATPEYNQSIPGVMKNAIDWLSRPDSAAVLDGRPAAIMGATTGPWGTRYAQKELRHALTAAGAMVMPQPMLFVAQAEQAFDAAGRLTDPALERRLEQLLTSFERWIGLLTATPQLISAEA